MTHRILIVDDHRDVIRLLHSALESLPHEFEILEAPSAEEASLELYGKPIDLLVLDYLLPGMTGLELFEKFKKRNQEAQIIFVSGTKDRKARKQLEEADAYAFFEKPVSLTDFLDAVERALGVELTVMPDETDDAHKTMSSLLAKFRQNMEAQALVLADDYGQVIAKAGSFPEDSDEKAITEDMLGIYRASLKISRHIKQESPLSYHIFPGGELDLMLVPVNKAHALIVAGERIAERNKVLDMTDAMMILKSEVAHVLNEMGLLDEPVVEDELPDLSDIFEADVVPEEQIEDEVSDAELEALFKQTDIGTADLESFWDEALDSHTNADVDSDKLTYEQAKQLGLTPEDGA